MLKLYALVVLLYGADGGLVCAKPGENVILQCFFESSAKYLSWYKQVAGEQPKIVSSVYKHLPDANSFHNQFEDEDRFSALIGEGFYHLKISNVQDSDSATYYCGKTTITVIEFQMGIFLLIKESSGVSFIVQPAASDSVKPGGSVTLNCTVHSGTCDGEHSVYWFKTPEESQPGLIYTKKNTCELFEMQSDRHTHTCVYNLPIKRLDRDHAGTYYCAVVSCGHILIGSGTKVEFEADEMNLMMGALVVTTILVVFLLFSLCVVIQRKSCKSKDSQAAPSAQLQTNAEVDENSHQLYYAALSVKLNKRGRRQRDPTWSECVYYSLK